MNDILRKLKRFILDKDYRFLIMDQRGWLNILSDRQHIRGMFHARMGAYPDLDNPRTFSEKLQWLKLHDRKPEYSLMVDKYEAKKIVAEIIGEEYIIPTYKVWDRAEDIDISDLPEQFVLKCTHDCGSLIICRDKSRFDLQSAKKRLKKCLKKNYYWQSREWPYKNVKPRIIAEKYMSDSEGGELSDYKVHCFEGVPKIILVCKNRFSEAGMSEDFFTSKWEHLDIHRLKYSNSEEDIKVPDCLEEMIDLSKRISQDIHFIRTDFYTVDNQIYFGELTFFPASGQ